MTVVKNKKALVIGGLGVTGRYIISELISQKIWDVVGISRSKPSVNSSVSFLSVDINDQNQSLEALSKIEGITHVFYTARDDKGDLSQQAIKNRKMLSNVISGLQHSSSSIEHIHLMHGMKAYGNFLGPFKTPALETDPRVPINLSYYAQEDVLIRLQENVSWSWSTLRPGAVLGVTLGYSGNLISIIGFYASICKYMGWPLWYPGTEAGFNALRQTCNAELLAKAAVWVSTNKNCVNQSFNVHNGDLFRWRDLWPQIADFFKIKNAGPLNLRLNDLMKDKDLIWKEIAKKNDLCFDDINKLVSWDYSNVFHNSWDSFADSNKIKSTGFKEYANSTESIFKYLRQLQLEKIIPRVE